MNPFDISVIAAIATPPGEGAIAIVRVSGEGALTIADRVFRGAETLAGAAGYTAHHGRVVTFSGGMVDDVVALVFRAPHSYTGEDTVEFNCHGGMLVTQEVLHVLLEAGARQAGPGEFTRRAFLNGKMDLSQAEAVADLIAARSERGRLHSLEQLEGKLGRRVGQLRTALVDLCALLELELDFSEEGIDLVGRDEIRRRVQHVDDALQSMVETYESGRIAREGVLVVLAGRTNAGKSSLFNALLGESRAIVTGIPGTTRDTIEESLTIDGILFRLVDTAGLRRANDPVEAEGMSRTRHQVRYADIVLLVEDASGRVEEEEIEDALHGLLTNQHLIVVFNKTDLVALEKVGIRYQKFIEDGAIVIGTSVTANLGIDRLKQCLVQSVTGSWIDSSETVVLTNERHLDSMVQARKSLKLTLDGIAAGQPNEFIAFDIREAVSELGEITGEVTTEEVLNSIFSRFCIGK
jgi:tRNA modification GTPase